MDLDGLYAADAHHTHTHHSYMHLLTLSGNLVKCEGGDVSSQPFGIWMLHNCWGKNWLGVMRLLPLLPVDPHSIQVALQK